jgi:arylformamidase
MHDIEVVQKPGAFLHEAALRAMIGNDRDNASGSCVAAGPIGETAARAAAVGKESRKNDATNPAEDTVWRVAAPSMACAHGSGCSVWRCRTAWAIANGWPPLSFGFRTGCSDVDEWRVRFDFAIEFANGGGLQGQDFRLDIDGDDIDDDALADYIVRDLRLLMVERVTILDKVVIRERHKRGQACALEAGTIAGRRIVDLSHAIEHGMVTYKGLPAPVICDFLSREQSRALYADGTEFHIGRIDLVANTGTYIDSPFHRHADGVDIAGLPLARLADVPAVVVRVTGQSARAIDRHTFESSDVRGKAVLVHTGWDANWRTDAYFEGHPFLTAAAAGALRDAGVALVGIDSYNIDDTGDNARPVHTILLGAGIPIVEHLCGLDQLPIEGARFTAVPAPVRGLGTFPVRAFATLD